MEARAKIMRSNRTSKGRYPYLQRQKTIHLTALPALPNVSCTYSVAQGVSKKKQIQTAIPKNYKRVGCGNPETGLVRRLHHRSRPIKGCFPFWFLSTGDPRTFPFRASILPETCGSVGWRPWPQSGPQRDQSIPPSVRLAGSMKSCSNLVAYGWDRKSA